ncbi:MAG: aspartate kinase [Rikenellaceae bacterium]|nr:aspartate kinase [Rikenellaceae bacterium]
MSKVLKFGGTSVGSAENMRKVADIVVAQKATVTVLSAMSGTTNALVDLAARAAKDPADKAIGEQIAMLHDKYSKCIGELLTASKNDALVRMEETLALIGREAAYYRSPQSERTILAQGELLTSYIFCLYMREAGYRAELLHAPDFLRKDDEDKVDMDLLERQLKRLVTDKDTYYITQGFICSDNDGEADNLGRGGSDYSAALVGGAINASEVQVWTDIDGMHNNDPRFVDNTYPIPRMSFDEAAELAYFGAKILHPATIQPCKDKGIPVYLKNTMDPDAEGTMISEAEDNSRIFHAVAAKDGITVIRIYSARMLMAYGFLRKVFEIFEQHRTPIDMITTSEVAVSITIDSDCHLEAIVADLRPLGTIEIEKNNTIVCLVGNLEHRQRGLAETIMKGINGVPLKMISYGASHRSIAMLVDTKYKKEVLQSLNDSLFTDPNA